MKKQILIEKYSEFYPYYDYSNPILLNGLIHRYTTYNDYNKVSLFYSQKYNSQCYYFLKVSEEMEEEYQLRLQFEKDLKQIDDQLNDLILKIAKNYTKSEDYLSEDYLNDCTLYKKLINHYGFNLMQMASCYDKKFDIWDSERCAMGCRKQKLEIRAFAYPKEVAKKMVNEWNRTHTTRDFCPSLYQDTLNIPFQKFENLID